MREHIKPLLKERYLQPGETEEQMYSRVGAAVAEAEKLDQPYWEHIFTNLMASHRFLPNTPTLVHAGVGNGRCLSACFVDSPHDDLLSITDVLYRIPLIERSGGGIGWGLSRLRPKGDLVNGRPIACGPVRVLRTYAQAGAMIAQGEVRPGAHMAQLRFNHPDILEFIHAKNQPGLENVNISVQITDEEMTAVREHREIQLINPRTGKESGWIAANTLWNAICRQAHLTGDPGVVFLDRVRAAHPNPELGEIQSSNPCGEEFLEDGNSCNLGSINLAAHYRDGKLDWRLLRETVKDAVRFLDNVIDINHYPFPEQRTIVSQTRRIGLGVMGWAELLLRMNIAYDSQEALAWAEAIGDYIWKLAHGTSAELAAEKGSPKGKKRNSSITTIAPTGSISIIAGTSSGIEPYYALFTRRVWTNGELFEMPAPIRERMRGVSDDTFRMFTQGNHTAQMDDLAEFFGADDAIVRAMRVAHQIDPEWHIRHQAAWQKNTDNGVSKTVNMPHHANAGDVANAYLLAFEERCKAVTVYRDGSLGEQILNAG